MSAVGSQACLKFSRPYPLHVLKALFISFTTSCSLSLGDQLATLKIKINTYTWTFQNIYKSNVILIAVRIQTLLLIFKEFFSLNVNMPAGATQRQSQSLTQSSPGFYPQQGILLPLQKYKEFGQLLICNDNPGIQSQQQLWDSMC